MQRPLSLAAGICMNMGVWVMENMDHETTRQLKTDLNDALRDLKREHSSFSTARMELDYLGNSSIRDLIDRNTTQIAELISKIKEEERSCSDYLQRYCPEFYSETSHYRAAEWLAEKNSEEAKTAKDRIAQAEWAIDEYARSKSRELANSFFDGLKRRYYDINTYGFGRPWGTTLRQRMAVAAGLKSEVDSLWDLGLNSVANSQHVYLGEHFIDLIKKDREMEEVRKMITEKIVSDIKSRIYRTPYLTVQRGDGRISSSERCKFGGERNKDDMLEQLSFTLRHPIDSLTKYADTWNVAMKELTWAIRHATVFFNGIYHVVYNMAGFAYIWEMQFSIEDTLDLRPHSVGKLKFDEDYNIVTSILGTAYHDLLGNTDKLKVRAYWNEMGADDTIHEW